MIRSPAGRISRIRYLLPLHKAANWGGQGRGRKSTRPGSNGVVELTPFEFLDRLADLTPTEPANYMNCLSFGLLAVCECSILEGGVSGRLAAALAAWVQRCLSLSLPCS